MDHSLNLRRDCIEAARPGDGFFLGDSAGRPFFWRRPRQFARAARRGIRILPGGDYGFVFTPHGTYARDLWVFVKILGFSPMETLVAATKLGGELMGRPGELGVVKAGALADLLLVDGDPLAHIEILQDKSALRMIMKDGALHKAPVRADA